MSKPFELVAKATLAALSAATILATLPGAASAQDEDDYGRGRLVTRCDGDGDRCATFRCDYDGDNCRRASGWRDADRSNYGGDYYRGGYEQGRITTRCDADGDRCASYRCDADGDRCNRVSGWYQGY